MTQRNDGIIALMMILALIAFVIGSAVGISISIDEHENTTQDNNTTDVHVENVTVEMTTNLDNDDDKVYYDQKEDNLDFNDNETLKKLNMTE